MVMHRRESKDTLDIEEYRLQTRSIRMKRNRIECSVLAVKTPKNEAKRSKLDSALTPMINGPDSFCHIWVSYVDSVFLMLTIVKYYNLFYFGKVVLEIFGFSKLWHYIGRYTAYRKDIKHIQESQHVLNKAYYRKNSINPSS